MSLTYRRDAAEMARGIHSVDDVVVIGEHRRTAYERGVKRLIDIVGSGVLLILTFPLMIIVALGVLIFLGRPVLYRQVRVTRDGKPFTMLKFRSMKPEREDEPRADGEFHAPRDDPRHTPFGQFIRRMSLDELPQLWNVLRGDMSLIGPRPELPEVCEAFELTDHPRHLVRPGMTGPWQVSEFRDGYVHMNVHLDAEYVGDLTFRRDAEIVLRTIGLFFGLGHEAHPDGIAPEPEPDRPLRVLHVLEPAIAGVPAYVEKLGQELAGRGVEQIVLTSDEQTWDFADWPKRVIRREWKRRPGDAVAIAGEIRRTVEDEKIDLVHAHATFAGVATRVRRMPVPVVYQPHGWGHLSTHRRSVARAVKTIEKRLDRRTDLLLTLSEHEAADAPKARPSERVRPIVELDGFGPLSEIDRRKVRMEQGWSPDERVHLCVGELSRRKNQVALVQEWRKLAPEGHRLVLVGDGADRKALEQIAADRVDLVGWRQDVDTLMAAADTLIVPSNGEGFSLVILEALATGLPVFSTSIGGTEIIGGDDGRVLTSVTEVVRAAVSSTIPAGDHEDRVARANRHHTAASLETVADEFIEIYGKALGRIDEPIDLRAVEDESSSSATASPR